LSDEHEALGKPNPLAQRALAVVFSLAAVILYASAFRDELRILFAVGCLISGRFVSVAVHELGHAIGAWVCGWRVTLIVIRPFGLQIPNRNLAIVPANFRPGASGWVSSVPSAPGRATRGRRQIIVAGGPVTSLTIAALAIIGAFTFLRPADGVGVLTGNLALGFAAQALYEGVITLLPARRLGWSSDGTQLRALRREDGNILIGNAIGWIAGLLDDKVRLRALPAWMLAEARRIAEDSDALVKYLATIEIGRALDSKTVDPIRARTLIEDHRALYGASGWLTTCDAWLAAAWEADAARAEAALAGPAEPPSTPELTLAAQAALAARQGNRALARAKLREMKLVVRRGSPFRDTTFCDIGRQIESLLI
jgi:hypothetical protein